MKNTLARIRNQAQSLVVDRRGANMVEYMIIVAVVALACIMAFTAFGSSIQKTIKSEGSKVEGLQ